MDRTLFADRLKQARKTAEFSRADFAVALGISYTMLSYYETGRNIPTVTRLIAIARLLGTSTDWLLGLQGKIASEPVRGAPEPLDIVSPSQAGKTALRATSRDESLSSPVSNGSETVPAF